MNEWVLVGIGVLALIVVMGGGGAMIRFLANRRRKQGTSKTA